MYSDKKFCQHFFAILEKKIKKILDAYRMKIYFEVALMKKMIGCSSRQTR